MKISISTIILLFFIGLSGTYGQLLNGDFEQWEYTQTLGADTL